MNPGTDNWQELWEARASALAAHFGPDEGRVWHCKIPLALGGGADVLSFAGHCGGTAYVTADLTGNPEQPANSEGQYELALCLRHPADWAPNLISRLAPYTIGAIIDPYETMDMAPSFPPPSTLSAFLFVPYHAFSLLGHQCTVLLCIGITAAELDWRWREGPEPLLRSLQRAGVFPFTETSRPCLAGAT